MFQIFVRSTAKRGYETRVVDVRSSDSVKIVKQKISHELNLPLHQMRLSFNSKPLNNNTYTIGDYNIVHGCSLEVTVRALPRCTLPDIEVSDMEALVKKYTEALIHIRLLYRRICNRVCQPLAQCKTLTQLFSTWKRVRIRANEEFAKIELTEISIIENTNEKFISMKDDILQLSVDDRKLSAPSNMELIMPQPKKKINLDAKLKALEKLELEFCLKVESECVNVHELLDAKFHDILHELEMDCEKWNTEHVIEWIQFIENGKFSDIPQSYYYSKHNNNYSTTITMNNNMNYNNNNNNNSNNNNNNNRSRHLDKLFCRDLAKNDSRFHMNREFIQTVRNFGIRGQDIAQINDSFLRFIGYAEYDRKLMLKNIACLLAISDSNLVGKGLRCLGCMKNNINSVIIPCGHQTYCMSCITTNDIGIGSRCPICRRTAERIVHTYLAGF